MKPIKTYTELLFRLKSANLDIKDFDYVDGKTKDENLYNHPFILRGKRFYNNPFFLSILFDNNLVEEVRYIVSMKEFIISYNILAAFVLSTQSFTEKIFKDLVKKYIENENIDLEQKENTFDNLMVDCAIAGNLEYYKYLEKTAIDNEIKPKHKTYSNAGNGYCLYNASKLQDESFVMYLLKDADVTLNDSMAFTIACKEANYYIALELAKHGIDIHTKRNLGLAMILRNDRLERNLDIPKRDRDAREELVKLFENDNNNTNE